MAFSFLLLAVDWFVEAPAMTASILAHLIRKEKAASAPNSSATFNGQLRTKAGKRVSTFAETLQCLCITTGIAVCVCAWFYVVAKSNQTNEAYSVRLSVTKMKPTV